MMLTCQNCHREHPLTDDDVVYFYPRFFCLSCGKKLPFTISEAQLMELRRTVDRNRKITEDLSKLPPQDQLRKVAAGAVDLESNG